MLCSLHMCVSIRIYVIMCPYEHISRFMHGHGIYESIMGAVKVRRQGIDTFIKSIGGRGKGRGHIVLLYMCIYAITCAYGCDYPHICTYINVKAYAMLQTITSQLLELANAHVQPHTK